MEPLSDEARAEHMTTVTCGKCGRDHMFVTRLFDVSFDILMRCGWTCVQGDGYRCPVCNGVRIGEGTKLVATIESTEREALREEIQRLFGEHAIGHNMIAVNAGTVLLLLTRADESDAFKARVAELKKKLETKELYAGYGELENQIERLEARLAEYEAQPLLVKCSADGCVKGTVDNRNAFNSVRYKETCKECHGTALVRFHPSGADILCKEPIEKKGTKEDAP